MEYVLRTTRHRNMIRRSEDLDYILAEYNNRCERFPAERFEIVDAQGDKIDVENITSGRRQGEASDLRSALSEITSEQIYEDTWDNSESASDSTD